MQEKDVRYEQNGVKLEGYLAWDDSRQDARPGVLVLPEWWGLEDYPKRRARQLAESGYVAFAADLYGEGMRTEDPKQAMQWAGALRADRQLMRDRAAAGLATLADQSVADAQKLAAIGYCFGGTAAVELAYTGADLRGVVSFHGRPQAPGEGDAGRINGSMLILHGGGDPVVGKDDLEPFFARLDQAGVDWQLIVYSGAKHAFTNPEGDKHQMDAIAYHAKADRRSWLAMQQFFDEIFEADA